MKKLYLETTDVAASRSAAEITAALVAAGATQIATEYEKGKIKSLRWMMNIEGRQELFDMPARVEPIYKIIKDRNRNTWLTDKQKQAMQEKAERIAWRQLLRWIQAQMAMIECGMAKPAEVFFAYVMTPNGETIYKAFEARRLKALPAPEKPQ